MGQTTKEDLARQVKASIDSGRIKVLKTDTLIAKYIAIMTYDGLVSFTPDEIKRLKRKRHPELINLLSEASKQVLMNESYKNIVV